MSSGICSGKPEEELKQQSCCIKCFSTLLEGCSPYGLCMQYHYHWLRLMLEILAALLLPGDWEIWLWVSQLKQLSSGKAEEIIKGEGSWEQPSNTTHCSTLHILQAAASKQLTCPSNQTCGVAALYILGLSPFMGLLLLVKQSKLSFGFSPFLFAHKHHSFQKKGDWRSSWCEIPFFSLKMSGIFQGFYAVQFMVFCSEI